MHKCCPVCRTFFKSQRKSKVTCSDKCRKKLSRNKVDNLDLSTPQGSSGRTKKCHSKKVKTTHTCPTCKIKHRSYLKRRACPDCYKFQSSPVAKFIASRFGKWLINELRKSETIEVIPRVNFINEMNQLLILNERYIQINNNRLGVNEREYERRHIIPRRVNLSDDQFNSDYVLGILSERNLWLGGSKGNKRYSNDTDVEALIAKGCPDTTKLYIYESGLNPQLRIKEGLSNRVICQMLDEYTKGQFFSWIGLVINNNKVSIPSGSGNYKKGSNLLKSKDKISALQKGNVM